MTLALLSIPQRCSILLLQSKHVTKTNKTVKNLKYTTFGHIVKPSVINTC